MAQSREDPRVTACWQRIKRNVNELQTLTGGNPTAVIYSNSAREICAFGNEAFTDIIHQHKEEIFNHPAYLARHTPRQSSAIYPPPEIPFLAMKDCEIKEFGRQLLEKVGGRFKFKNMPSWWPNTDVPWATSRINPKKKLGQRYINAEDYKK